MLRNYVLACLLGISTCLLINCIDAHEALIDGTEGNSTLVLRYVVSVQINHVHVCGGGIIHDRFILTVAHCLLNRSRQLYSKQISILAGTNSLQKTSPPAVIVRVTTVFFPKAYHPGIVFSHSDIAVLKLADSLKLGPHTFLQKLLLPTSYNRKREAIFGGFGWTKYSSFAKKGGSNPRGSFQCSLVTVLTDEECENTYPYGIIYPDILICAKLDILFSRTNGVCYGDDGGPLIDSRDKKTVYGILSRVTPNCDEKDEPAIYTNVLHHAMMIFNIILYSHDPESISVRL